VIRAPPDLAVACRHCRIEKLERPRGWAGALYRTWPWDRKCSPHGAKAISPTWNPFSLFPPILPASSSLHAWRGSGAIKESSPFPSFLFS
jgi:hypothetical protein